jgi:hypothetical protein
MALPFALPFAVPLVFAAVFAMSLLLLGDRAPSPRRSGCIIVARVERGKHCLAP